MAISFKSILSVEYLPNLPLLCHSIETLIRHYGHFLSYPLYTWMFVLVSPISFCNPFIPKYKAHLGMEENHRLQKLHNLWKSRFFCHCQVSIVLFLSNWKLSFRFFPWHTFWVFSKLFANKNKDTLWLQINGVGFRCDDFL